MAIVPDIEKFIDAGGVLTAYAIESRYPAPRIEVNKLQAREAIETARSIYEFILKSLPDLEKLPQE